MPTYLYVQIGLACVPIIGGLIYYRCASWLTSFPSLATVCG
jgi:hypothetical protein